MHPNEFWELTLGDFYDCLDGYKDRIDTEIKINDYENFLLGQYVAMGVHASKKHPYPKKPFLSKTNESDRGFTKDSDLDAYIVSMAKKGGK